MTRNIYCQRWNKIDEGKARRQEEVLEFLRNRDYTDQDDRDIEELEERRLLIDEILETCPEIALIRMITKYGNSETPKPGLVILYARIGGLMRTLNEMTLGELEECLA